MKITEKDIFMYVHAPESLDKEKSLFIKKNENKFSKEIALCNSIPNMELIESNEMIDSSKLSTNQRILFCQKIVRDITNGNNNIKFAAASTIVTKGTSVNTYKDESSSLLVKIIRYENKHYLYLIDNENKELKNVRIKIHPSLNEYFMPTNKDKLYIEENTEIEGIEIKTEDKI